MAEAEKKQDREMVPISLWRRRFRVFWSGWDARVAALFAVFLLALVIGGPEIWPDSGREVSLMLKHQPPSVIESGSGHVLGTDHLGRDLLYRILGSARLTLMIAGLATLLATIAGTTAGLVTGYFRGKIDAVISQLVDIMLSFPVLLLVLALVATLGRSLTSVVIVLALSVWAEYTRVIRSVVLSLVEQDFVEAARAVGGNSFRIIVRHLLPNIASPVLVLSTLNLARAILTESAISFLGLGPAPPDVTWGGMIGEGRNHIFQAWWSSLFPGAMIFVTVLCFNFLGDAMREAFDPFTTRKND